MKSSSSLYSVPSILTFSFCSVEGKIRISTFHAICTSSKISLKVHFIYVWNSNFYLGIDNRFEIGGIDNTTRETDVDSVFHVNSGSVMGYRRTTDGGSEYNGLYVPPASESDYGYLSPPTRPPLPYLNGIHRFRGDDSLRDGTSPNVINVYPEDEGHLVWSGCIVNG